MSPLVRPVSRNQAGRVRAEVRQPAQDRPRSGPTNERRVIARAMAQPRRSQLAADERIGGNRGRHEACPYCFLDSTQASFRQVFGLVIICV